MHYSAFLASLFKDAEGNRLPWRAAIHRMGQDLGRPVFVAEIDNADVCRASGLSPFEVCDRLTEIMRRCGQLIVVLIPRDMPLGARLMVDDIKSAVSYIEIEVATALIAGLPIHVLVRTDFTVTTELNQLLKIVGSAVHPDRIRTFKCDDEIPAIIAGILAGESGHESAIDFSRFLRSGITIRMPSGVQFRE